MIKQTSKNSLILLLKASISLGLLGWFFSKLDWNQAVETVANINSIYLLAAFLAIQLTVFASVWKWKLTIESYGIPSPSIGYLLRLYYIGLFFNNFLPSSIGGDVIRIYYLGKKIEMMRASATVVFERLTSGIAMIVVVMITSLFFSGILTFLLKFYIVIAVFISIFFILFYLIKRRKSSLIENNKTWVAKIRKLAISFIDSFSPFKKQCATWWGKVALLSLAFQFGMAWINQLIFKGFGIEVPFYQLLLFITLISFLTMLPISINGLGVREAGYLLLFAELGIISTISIAASLLFFILVAITSLMGGVFWLMEKEKKNEVIRE